MINEDELLDKIEEIQDYAHSNNIGSNEEQLEARIEIVKYVMSLVSKLPIHGVSGCLQADIRNKLSPVANLVAMLEDNAPQEYIDKEMKAVKKSVDYLSNYR